MDDNSVFSFPYFLSLHWQELEKLELGWSISLSDRVSGFLGWREQVMAFWSALIYTPPFLSLSSVKRWERWGAAFSHSCELHLPGVRGSIGNSDLIPSTKPNYYMHHVIYTSYIGSGNIFYFFWDWQFCSCRINALSTKPNMAKIERLNILIQSGEWTL